jgi:protease IV
MKSKYLLIGGSIFVVLFIFIIFAIVFAKALLGSKGNLVIRDSIGVMEVRGVITDSRETIYQLHEFRDNDRIKAVILRIDSPGGVVGPSQEIYEEVKKFTKKKPLVVSMGSVAASGGYYIAAPSSMIYANPGTITGSIGVLMKLSNVQNLLEKIGMNSFVLKSGEFKDSGSPFRKMTEREKQVLQGVIDNMQGQFVRAVSEGRKIPVDKVKLLADGRIYTGEQALEAKLIDRIGNLQDAVEATAKMVGIKGEPKLVYPPEKKKTLIDLLIEGSTERIMKQLKSESDIQATY